MRAKFLAMAAVSLLLSAPVPAIASSVSGARVLGLETVGTPSGHVVYVFTDGTRINGTPACSDPNFPNRWALDPTTPMGQATYSLLLTARGLNDTITLYGYGACELAGDAETIIFAGTNNVLM